MRHRLVLAAVASMALALGIHTGHASAQSSAGDVPAGAGAFNRRCALCHAAAGVGGPLGPPLKGVVGAPAGKSAYAKYSKALLASKSTWTPAALDE